MFCPTSEYRKKPLICVCAEIMFPMTYGNGKVY